MPTASGSMPPGTASFSRTLVTAPSGPCPRNAVFVTDAGTNAIDVFAGRGTDQEMCAQISSGLSGPQGLAGGAPGHVFVANTNDSNILEFAGPYPPGRVVRTIPMPTEYPIDVAVSTSGLLAAINICSSPSCGPGNVALYRKGATAPCATASSPQFAKPFFGAFDANDDLYVSGSDASGGLHVGEVTGGCKATTIATLSVPGIAAPGGIGVDAAGNVAIGDEERNQIDVFAPGNFSKPKFVVPLQDGSAAGFVFSSSGKQLWTTSGGSATAVEYRYPAGGAPIDTLNGFVEPAGVGVTPAQVP